MSSRNVKFASSSISDFNGLSELHRSSTGAVYVGTFRYDNTKYILKERRYSELGVRSDLMHEVNLLTQLNHPNIVTCEGWFRDEKNKSLFIVLEYCEGGDLQSFIKFQKSGDKPVKFIPEELVWIIFEQICDGVLHLHENGIIHRDLKPLNIMLCKRGGNKHRIKIVDLGVSRQVSHDTDFLKTFYGTPLYISPELVENKHYNEKTDIWSLGVILYELVTLTVPFNGGNILDLAKAVVAGKFAPISSPIIYSTFMSRVIQSILIYDFKKRPSISQLIKCIKQRSRTHTPTNTLREDIKNKIILQEQEQPNINLQDISSTIKKTSVLATSTDITKSNFTLSTTNKTTVNAKDSYLHPSAQSSDAFVEIDMHKTKAFLRSMTSQYRKLMKSRNLQHTVTVPIPVQEDEEYKKKMGKIVKLIKTFEDSLQSSLMLKSMAERYDLIKSTERPLTSPVSLPEPQPLLPGYKETPSKCVTQLKISVEKNRNQKNINFYDNYVTTFEMFPPSPQEGYNIITGGQGRVSSAERAQSAPAHRGTRRYAGQVELIREKKLASLLNVRNDQEY